MRFVLLFAVALCVSPAALAVDSMGGRKSTDVGGMSSGLVRFKNTTGGTICDFEIELIGPGGDNQNVGASIGSIEVQDVGEAAGGAGGGEQEGPPGAAVAGTEYGGAGATPLTDFDVDDNGDGDLNDNGEGDDAPPGRRSTPKVKLLDRSANCIANDAEFQIRFVLSGPARPNTKLRITPSTAAGDLIASVESTNVPSAADDGVFALAVAAVALAAIAVLLFVFSLRARRRQGGNSPG